MATEATLLRARGVELKLGGQPHRLRYDFDAMEKIETEYDGLDDFVNGLLNWQKRYRTIRRALEIGLAELTPEQIAVGLNDTTGADLLDLMRSIAMALTEAMGVEISLDPSDPKAEGDEESPGQSPGEDSTGTPLSVMDGQTPSSGE